MVAVVAVVAAVLVVAAALLVVAVRVVATVRGFRRLSVAGPVLPRGS
ncbi:hypothetical protein ACTI_06560 [Actinoplanes sp. OR16]|nr:hypothetical protein ACTI_06560 [Actinoplanes sp. OR16]